MNPTSFYFVTDLYLNPVKDCKEARDKTVSVSKITLCIPNYGNIESKGEARSDKKTSFDSAVVQMLLEVKRLGKVEIDHLPSS